MVRPTNLPLPDPIPEELDSPMEYNFEQEESYDEDYYMAIVNMADEINRTLGRYFNYGKEGHQWCDCPEPLRNS